MQHSHSTSTLAKDMRLRSHQSQTSFPRGLFSPESNLSQSSIIHSAIMWLSIQSPLRSSRSSIFIQLVVAGNLPSTPTTPVYFSLCVSLLLCVSPTLVPPPPSISPFPASLFSLISLSSTHVYFSFHHIICISLIFVFPLAQVGFYLFITPFCVCLVGYMYEYLCLPNEPSRPMLLSRAVYPWTTRPLPLDETFYLNLFEPSPPTLCYVSHQVRCPRLLGPACRDYELQLCHKGRGATFMLVALAV